MPYAVSSSPDDASRESSYATASQNSSRQPSYHESDAAALPPQNYTWLPPILPLANFPIPHVQSLDSIQTALGASSALMLDGSPARYHQEYSSIAPGEDGDSFAMRQHASSWGTYTSDTASVDLHHDPSANIHRTDSTLSFDSPRRKTRASMPIYPRSKSPLKAESSRASRSRSIAGVVTPPTDAGVKKLRKSQLRANSSRRGSISLPPLPPLAPTVKALSDAPGRMHSPPKEEAVSNDELLSSEDEDSRHRPKGTRKEPTFACPFYRRWPTRHIDCMNRKLTRIQDVKQHIYRRHSKSQIYCPTCGQDFSSPDPRDKHIRAGLCRPGTASSNHSSDGISAQLQDSLKNRFRGKLKPVEQWYGIWSLIFPDVPAPKNAHIGNMVTEMMVLLRDFWRYQSHRIIPDVGRTGTAQSVADEDVHVLMAQVLDKVQDHFDHESSQVIDTTKDITDGRDKQVMDRSYVEGELTAAEDGEQDCETSPIQGWDFICYSANGSPTITMGTRPVEPTVDLGSSGMPFEQHCAEQSWTGPPMANPIVNRFQ